MAFAPTPPAPTSVTFWGAARTVTGSMHRLDADGRTILLDCGLFQGRRSESRERNEGFPFRPKNIDAVILSHAHIDHCGNLPNLVRQGFTGPIYCTPATRALAGVMLGDAAKIQEEDAAFLNRRREKGESRVEPLYTGRDVYRTLLQLHARDYGMPFEVGPSIIANFFEAGHLLGSAMVGVRIGEKRLTFTGDLGRPGLPILRDPAPVPACDLLISESTYGGITHEPVDETAERLGEIVRRTAERHGKLVIPAFAVGRTQTIIYFLHQLKNAGLVPDVPVFVDSPMAVRATEVFQAHSEVFNTDAQRLLAANPEIFGGGWLKYVEKVHDSIAINDHRGPCVIISASGMCESGRVLHHLKHTIENPNNTVLIAGFQAEHTLGRRLVERRPEVRILGRPYKLNAEVEVLNGLSSHADHRDLLQDLGPLAAAGTKVRLVHGEPDRAAVLADGLRSIGFNDVAIPDRGDSVGL